MERKDAEDPEEVSDEIDDGPGLGCTFPDRRRSKTVSHVIVQENKSKVLAETRLNTMKQQLKILYVQENKSKLLAETRLNTMKQQLKILYVLLHVFALTDVIGGFLLSSQCVAPLPCTCTTVSVSCESNQLSHVPPFSEHNEHFSYLKILLGWNYITRIPANSFKNLSSIHAARIDIDLQRNYLNQIDLHAFAGIQASVISLNLKYNNFTYLPSGLNDLTALVSLNIDRNPLTSLDATTISTLGRTLLSFTSSMGHFSAFPTEMHFLTKLKSLILNNIPFSRLNSDVFQGLETSLTTLKMSKSKLEKIPAAICYLKALQILSFTQFQNLTKGSSIFENCNASLDAVTTLTLEENKLSNFPNVFNLFPNLISLNLRENNLQLIENSSIKYISTLTHLDLNGNNFTRIPAAINTLSNITHLYFAFNHILSIEDSDLRQLSQLKYLDLYDNPLAYISPNAFQHNLLLYDIDFDFTKLTRLPIALVGLPNLHSISVSSESQAIECSCSAMAYLKSWNVTAINLMGECSTGDDLKTYLTSALPKCP